ncbi:MAG: hypothetical protein IAE79_24475 [Anaerolinea sp.]|nr:hypothetical protein [Anaerolinea sp.]
MRVQLPNGSILTTRLYFSGEAQNSQVSAIPKADEKPEGFQKTLRVWQRQTD